MIDLISVAIASEALHCNDRSGVGVRSSTLHRFATETHSNNILLT